MEMTLTWKCFLNVRLMDVKDQDCFLYPQNELIKGMEFCKTHRI